MSSSIKPNMKQLPDFIKMDHAHLVEELRRWELKIVYQFNLTARCLQRQKETGKNECYSSSASPDPWGYDDLDDGFCILSRKVDKELYNFYSMLKHYYKYDERYFEILNDYRFNYEATECKFEELPVDHENYHDCFWGSDPTNPRSK